MNKDVFGYDVYEVFGGYLELRPDAVPRMAKYHPGIPLINGLIFMLYKCESNLSVCKL